MGRTLAPSFVRRPEPPLPCKTLSTCMRMPACAYIMKPMCRSFIVNAREQSNVTREHHSGYVCSWSCSFPWNDLSFRGSCTQSVTMRRASVHFTIWQLRAELSCEPPLLSMRNRQMWVVVWCNASGRQRHGSKVNANWISCVSWYIGFVPTCGDTLVALDAVSEGLGIIGKGMPGCSTPNPAILHPQKSSVMQRVKNSRSSVF